MPSLLKTSGADGAAARSDRAGRFRWPQARLAAALAITVVGVPLAAIGGHPAASPTAIAAAKEDAIAKTARDNVPKAAPGPGPAPSSLRVPSGEPVSLAFAGDVNVEGDARAVLTGGLTAIAPALGAADLTMLNLETAVTEEGEGHRVDKQYAFRAPATTLRALQQAGVDVVTMANNHGMDYGVPGLRGSLAAAERARMPLVGIGVDERSAYAPHVTTVRGQRIAVLGATQVFDSTVEKAWTAQGARPGLASAKRVDRLLAEVWAIRPDADTVVVYLHWGRELAPCPLPQQRSLARQLVGAGADVLVGTHAHVLLGGGYLDGAYVDYGLGNFAFAARRSETSRTGVLTLTVEGRAVTDSRWTPAVVRRGVPIPLEGAAAPAAVWHKRALSTCAGFGPS